MKRFDEKSFRADHPALWQEYARERPGSRRFVVKGGGNGQP